MEFVKMQIGAPFSDYTYRNFEVVRLTKHFVVLHDPEQEPGSVERYRLKEGFLAGPKMRSYSPRITQFDLRILNEEAKLLNK